MRPYSDKQNVQKKPYYSDRYFVAPQIPKETVESNAVFAQDLAILQAKFEVKEAYIQRGQLVVYIDARDNVALLQTLKNECAYNILSEHSAIDWLAKSNEFELFYQLLQPPNVNAFASNVSFTKKRCFKVFTACIKVPIGRNARCTICSVSPSADTRT